MQALCIYNIYIEYYYVVLTLILPGVNSGVLPFLFWLGKSKEKLNLKHKTKSSRGEGMIWPWQDCQVYCHVRSKFWIKDEYTYSWFNMLAVHESIYAGGYIFRVICEILAFWWKVPSRTVTVRLHILMKPQILQILMPESFTIKLRIITPYKSLFVIWMIW